MLSNLVLVLIAVLVLGFIALLWLRQGLARELTFINELKDLLKKDLERRRNVVPMLLAGYQKEHGKNEAWTALLHARAELNNGASWSEEWDFEERLHRFIMNHKSTELAFLEARNDIQDLRELIEAEKRDLAKAKERLSARRKQFPYSLASAIFGYQKIPL